MGSDINFDAILCFSDAVYRPAIRRQVSALLKQSPPDDQQFQAFLDGNGYKASPAAVRAAFEALKDQRPKITPRGVRFAAEFLTNSNLRTDWVTAAKAAAAAPPRQGKIALAAGQPDPALAPLQNVLDQHGYQDLTPEEAAVAQANLIDDAAAIWAGVYQTTVTPRRDGLSTHHEPPTFTVSQDHIKLGAISLIGAAFADDGLTLDWIVDPPGAVSENGTTGALTFSTRADGSKAFSGRLTYVSPGRGDAAWEVGEYDFKGVAPAPVAQGGAGSSGSDPATMAGLIVAAVSLVVGVVGAYIAYRQWRQAEPAAAEPANPPVDPPANPPVDPPANPDPNAGPAAADPMADPHSSVSRRMSDLSDMSDDFVSAIEPPLGPDVLARIAPGPVVELGQMISAPPSAPVAPNAVDDQAAAAADDLSDDDEFESANEAPEPAPAPDPVVD